MDKVLVFNQGRCTGCGLCELTCSLVHTETCNPERSRIRILRMEEKGLNVLTFCQQCEDAACIAACPVSAISNNKGTGLIEIDHELCVQCMECVAKCPFKAIYFDRIDERIIACDFCGGTPECVTYCETKAIEFVERGSVAMQKKREFLQEFEQHLKLAEADFGS